MPSGLESRCHDFAVVIEKVAAVVCIQPCEKRPIAADDIHAAVIVRMDEHLLRQAHEVDRAEPWARSNPKVDSKGAPKKTVQQSSFDAEGDSALFSS